MISEDLSLLIFYVVCMICMVIAGILQISNERHKQMPDYTGGIMTIIGGLTPGCMFIGAFVLLVVIMYIVIELPNKALKRLLNKKQLEQ